MLKQNKEFNRDLMRGIKIECLLKSQNGVIKVVNNNTVSFDEFTWKLAISKTPKTGKSPEFPKKNAHFGIFH